MFDVSERISIAQVFARRRRMRVVLVTTICACAAVLVFALTVYFFQSSETALANVTVMKDSAQQILTRVVVSNETISAGASIDPAMVRYENWPELQAGEKTVRDLSELAGKYAREQIRAGMPINRDVLTTERPVGLLTAKIPVGYRAVTISVDVKSSVEGWVRPGGRVDVAWTARIRNQAGITVIVENAHVLSAERRMENMPQAKGNGRGDNSAPVPSTVTLMVTEGDANRIHLASTTGALTLLLRGDDDKGKTVGTHSITTQDLLEGRAGFEQTKAPPSTSVLTVKKSDGQKTEFTFINGQLVPLAN